MRMGNRYSEISGLKIESKKRFVEGTTMSTARSDDLVATVAYCLMDKEKRGEHHQKECRHIRENAGDCYQAIK